MTSLYAHQRTSMAPEIAGKPIKIMYNNEDITFQIHTCASTSYALGAFEDSISIPDDATMLYFYDRLDEVILEFHTLSKHIV